jgi:hypothetical protein
LIFRSAIQNRAAKAQDEGDEYGSKYDAGDDYRFHGIWIVWL